MAGANPEPVRKGHEPLPHGISPAAAVLTPDALMEHLPDTRSTQRLLNVLGKLEAYHANLAAAGGVAGGKNGKALSGAAITSELNRLRQENRRLKVRQRHAIEHLDAILARLPDGEDAPTSGAQLVQSLLVSDGTTAPDAITPHTEAAA